MSENGIEGTPVTWIDFEEIIEQTNLFTEDLKAKKPSSVIHAPLYRGHSKASYELKSTLERYLEEYSAREFSFKNYYDTMYVAKLAVSSLTSQKFHLPDFQETLSLGSIPIGYEFMIYLRHHGFPSPLLDWTRSPYVAAYFAFNKAEKGEAVAIYICRESIVAYFVGERRFVIAGPYVEAHKRHYQQSCEYTISYKITDKKYGIYCPYDEGAIYKSHHLSKYIISAEERETVLTKLDLMNINAFTLFGNEESLMEMLAFREIAWI